MRIHPEGYFVGPVGASGRPVGFRKQGYVPVEITPTGGPGSVELVGEVRLEPLPKAMRAGVVGKLVLDGATGVSGATSRLTIQTGPINTASGRYLYSFSDSVNVTVMASGEF